MPKSSVSSRKGFALINRGTIKGTSQGFTLIELMVVIAIIAIISAVGIVVYSSAQKAGRISKRLQDIQAVQTALELYKNATGGYPAQNGWACAGTALSGVLTPSYMPIIPADPLDSGNAAGPNCYQYTTGASGGVTNEFKLRTNTAIYGTNGEMNSTAFEQQRQFLDPAQDGAVDCVVATQTGAILYKGWAVYSGTNVCDD